MHDECIEAGSSEWPMILGVDGTAVGMRAVENGELLGTVINDAKGQAQGMLELARAITAEKELDQRFQLLEGKYIRLPYRKVTGETI